MDREFNPTMELRDVHPDIERYLEDECYTPYEIYDTVPGWNSYMLFPPDSRCEIVVEGKDRIAVIAESSNEQHSGRPQLILFSCDEDDTSVMVNAERFEPTENNIGIIFDIVLYDIAPDGRKLDV